ncbi:MAG: 2-hydroxyacid dehydrogenase, partial [Gemmatimonadetes bacterium]|nr:2-hydroxyacid dehydrogenase [Gemmatimonadota bacterium]
IALLLALNRKVHRAYNRVRDGNFALEGLLGFDIHGLTAGVIGTGKIGRIVARILMGFGCHVLVNDPYPHAEFAKTGVRYVPRDELIASSDIITLHCPLTPETHHLIDADALARMKPGATLINTSRGALVDAVAVVEALKSSRLGFLGLDVYEEESDLFFEDLSSQVIQDDVFARLTTFPNVIITGHQAFFTRNALENIASTTLGNVREFEETGACANEVTTALLGG